MDKEVNKQKVSNELNEKELNNVSGGYTAYDSDGDRYEVKCPKCGSSNYYVSGGCAYCSDCGYCTDD